MPAAKAKPDRDLEKTEPKDQFITKLRRLADCLEADKPFNIQIANERIYVPQWAIVNIEHERERGTEEIEFQVKWGRERSLFLAETNRDGMISMGLIL